MNNLIGDVTPEDWEEFLGCTWEEYVEPIAEQCKRLPRTDVIRPVFNDKTLDQDGWRNMEDVVQFYGSDFYSRLLAYEFGRQNCFSAALSCMDEQFHGAPMECGLMDAVRMFGDNILVFEHGFNLAHYTLLMAKRAPKPLYLLCDVKCDTRRFVMQMLRKYVPDLRFAYIGVRDDGVPEIPKTNQKVNYLVSSEVLEHVPDPVACLRYFRSVMVDSGLMYLSTFFNSMCGQDALHLIEHEGYQQTELWFAQIENAGFKPYKADDNGVMKLWQAA